MQVAKVQALSAENFTFYSLSVVVFRLQQFSKMIKETLGCYNDREIRLHTTVQWRLTCTGETSGDFGLAATLSSGDLGLTTGDSTGAGISGDWVSGASRLVIGGRGGDIVKRLAALFELRSVSGGSSLLA